MDSRRIDGFRGRHRTVECEGLLVLDVPRIHDRGRRGGALGVFGFLVRAIVEGMCYNGMCCSDFAIYSYCDAEKLPVR